MQIPETTVLIPKSDRANLPTGVAESVEAAFARLRARTVEAATAAPVATTTPAAAPAPAETAAPAPVPAHSRSWLKGARESDEEANADRNATELDAYASHASEWACY